MAGLLWTWPEALEVSNGIIGDFPILAVQMNYESMCDIPFGSYFNIRVGM